MTLETPPSAFSPGTCRPPLLAPAARALLGRAADLAQHVLTEPAAHAADRAVAEVFDVQTVSDDITYWLGVLSGDVPASEHAPGFRARGAAHAARSVPLEDALLLQHSCVDAVTRALVARLAQISPRAGRVGLGRQVDGLALAALRPATAEFAAGYRDAARAAGTPGRPPAPERRPFAWCLATGPGGRADGAALRRFRAGNPQALVTMVGPGYGTLPGSVPGAAPAGAAFLSFTAFSHDHPAVPDGLGPHGIVPVENGDTTRAARRAAIAAVLARHYGLDRLDGEQARPLLAALDLTPRERETFLASVLGPLHDSARNEHLVETLEAYLSHNLCTTAAARSLYVHRHTFAYRMRRIRTLTGLDPDRPYHRLRAELAVLMSRMPCSPAVPQQRTAA